MGKRTATAAILIVTLTLGGLAGGQQAPPAAKATLKDAPANTWVKVAEEASGGRVWPLFYFDPKVGRFILSGGGHEGPVHFDTESFDLATGQWTNLYPKDAPYKNESGPTDAPSVDFREKEYLKADKYGVQRLFRHLNPYGRDPGIYYQYAYAPPTGKIFAYFQDKTLTFDPATRQWDDTKAPTFSRSAAAPNGDFPLVYGALAYDPVNQEIVSSGGVSDWENGTPGTVVFRAADNQWKPVPSGSDELRKVASECRLSPGVAAFVNTCRNRFYGAESETESKVDLQEKLQGLQKSVTAVQQAIAGAKVRDAEQAAVKVAAAEIAALIADLKALDGKFGKVDADVLVQAAALLGRAERIARTLTPEPCPRAVAPLAVDPVAGKIVVFGGCRFDGFLGDTWVYDCKTRTWEQRFPAVSPAPRGGHTLAYLPKSGKIVLYGGTPFTNPYNVPHGNPRPPRDLWTYDIAANTWKLIAAETKDAPQDGVAAVDANDTLVLVSTDTRNRAKRVTWAMKIDAATADAGSAKAGAAPGAYLQSFTTPTDFDRVAKPDAPAVAKLIADAPANQWTLLPRAPRKPNAHPWGTTPYDAKRHQLLAWGGGHSAWHFNDVAHYSLRTALWSTGYADEYPYATASFKSMFNQTFNNRPMIPTHVWDAAAYDPVADRVVFCVRGGTWTYDPARRDWDYPPGPRFPGDLHVSMQSTPQGVVHWDKDGKLHRFDGKKREWLPLPVKDGKLGGAYGDTTGICHDPKRDCLWLANDGGPMHRYDLATGSLTTIPTPKPEYIVMRETAYIPELDMILSAGRVKSADGELGNLAYDIENNRWLGVVLPCSDGQPRLNDKPYSQISLTLHYDPKLKFAVYLANNQDDVFVARFDKAKAKTFAVKMLEPKGKQ